MSDIDQVLGIALDVRQAFDRLDVTDYPYFWGGKFPRGTCGDVTLILGAHLTNLGFSGFFYASGERRSRKENTWVTHAWLKREELDVDITADQFHDSPGAVIVATSSIWHSQFTMHNLTDCDYRNYNPVQVELYRLHDAIKPLLKIK